MREVLLGVEPFPQPHPVRNPGGDCFACSLLALLRHLFPERPPSFDQVFGYFKAKTTTGSECLSNTWYGYRQALWNAFSDGYRMEITADIVVPSFDPDQWSHAWWDFVPSGEWSKRLEGYLRGGWVGVAEIRQAGGGPRDSEGRRHTPDHFVLLDGIRSAWESTPGTAGRALNHYVHVVCSAKGAYWIPVMRLLMDHGAAGWRLARREDAA